MYAFLFVFEISQLILQKDFYFLILQKNFYFKYNFFAVNVSQ